MTQKQRTILVELDCLLDTRLGTVNRLSAQLAEQLAKSDAYYSRESDTFDGLDDEQYRALYAKRDRETLRHSAPSEGFAFVGGLAGLLREKQLELNAPERGEVRIAVNLFPYDLSESERAEIGRALAVRFRGAAPVEVVYIPHSALTPAVVRTQYPMLVMYEYDPWLSLHYDVDPKDVRVAELMEKLLLDVTLFSPAIYYRTPPDAGTLKHVMQKSAHPLLETEMLVNMLVGLNLVDVALFSLMRR